MEKTTAGILFVAAFTLANEFYTEHRLKQIEKQRAEVTIQMSDDGAYVRISGKAIALAMQDPARFVKMDHIDVAPDLKNLKEAIEKGQAVPPEETWGSTGPATATGKGSIANSGHIGNMSVDENNKMNGWTDLKSPVNADPGATMTGEEFLNLLQETHGKTK